MIHLVHALGGSRPDLRITRGGGWGGKGHGTCRGGSDGMPPPKEPLALAMPLLASIPSSGGGGGALGSGCGGGGGGCDGAAGGGRVADDVLCVCACFGASFDAVESSKFLHCSCTTHTRLG